jgi:hypothetical protein
MKRQTALALAAVFSLSVAGTALAAPANPFVDVPAKHWSYDSVNKLAQAGVISGYGDGTFKGDKTLTRYEMATIVAKAMANSDKADAETKKTIEALKAEYGTELANLGVRVDNLEKNASKVKFTGEVRERYDWQDDVDSGSMTRLRLNMESKIADNVTFHGRYESESGFGDGSNNQSKLTQAYIAGEIGSVGYSFGRQPVWLGQGLIADISGNADGLFLSGGKDVKVAAGVFKKKGTTYPDFSAASENIWGVVDTADDANDYSLNFYAANIDAKLSKALDLSVSYLKDKDGVAYKTTSAGLNYTGIKNFTLNGEFGQNDSAVAKAYDGDKAKAWMGKVKYLGADPAKVGSLGVWVGYRSADPGFDVAALTTLDSGLLDTSSSYIDNVKGTEFGVEYTVFRNGILSLQYGDQELKEAAAGVDKDKKNFFATLIYTF